VVVVLVEKFSLSHCISSGIVMVSCIYKILGFRKEGCLEFGVSFHSFTHS
jgi:hypothetical protein